MRRLALLLAFASAPAAAQNDLRGDLIRARGESRPAPRATGGDSPSRSAATAYREGRLKDAVDGYDRAAAEAFRAGATGAAFEFGLAAAEIQRQRGESADAAKRFRRAALRNANDPRAPKAHHAACVAAGSALGQGATVEQLAAYDELLAEHAENWPLSPHAADAEWRRVELLATTRQWTRVVNRVRDVDPQDARYQRSRTLLVTAYRGLLANPAEDPLLLLQQATDDLLPIVLDAGGRWPAEWSPRQRDAADALASMHLSLRPDGADYAAQLLRVALSGEPPPAPTWRRRAISLLVPALLATGGEADAALAAEVPSPDERRRLLARADETLRGSGPLAAANRLRSTLDALNPLAGSAPSGDAAIEALLAAGRDDAAIEQLAERATAAPEDREAQAAFARQLAESRDSVQQERALERWRSIETRSQRRTPEWFEARLARLRLLASLGRRDDAIKLLKLTHLVAPDLGGDDFANEFAALSESLQ